MRFHLAFAFALIAGRVFAADAAPDWVQEASTRTLPAYPAEVHAATLVDEMRVTVQPDGSTVTQIRSAVRILSHEDNNQAQAVVPYFRKVTRINNLQAWLITPARVTHSYGKNDVLDIAVQESFDLYSDQRARVIRSQSPPPGCTFAWAAEYQDQPFVPQLQWFFQDWNPSLTSKLILTVPSGWQARAVTVNHDPIQPVVEGNTYTWQLTNLNYIKHESHSPQAESLAPWIGVTYFPGDSASTALRNWNQVGLFQEKFVTGQDSVDTNLSAAIHNLTASSAATLDRIRALARCAQKIHYVEISLDTAHGGGYRPHAASEVYKKQYGDCKDKANLLHTMLQQIGIRSYLVTVYSGDRNHVRPEWPSPGQFNHMILAISVPDDVSFPAVAVHPSLGRLLFFDPTNPYVPLGLIPGYEQGSYGMIIAGENSTLVPLPTASPETNREEIRAQGSLTPDGQFEAQASLKERADNAARLRSMQESQQSELSKFVDARLTRTVKQVDNPQINIQDSFDTGELSLDVRFKAPRFAQSMQGRLLVFKPSIFEPLESFPFHFDARSNPVVLDAASYSEQVRIKLPDNFKVDETPDPADFRTTFGHYSATYKVEGGELLFSQELIVSPVTLPANDYASAREFFSKVVGAERAPMVLVKN